ncbi:HEAT STRESS TOLERANT DWD 1-like protein [Drosera capensis]
MPRRLKNSRKPKTAEPKGEGSSPSLPAMVPASAPARVWEPGVDGIGEGEELQCDPSAYDSLHAFHVGWPCLSFDILRDSLGLVRTEFPHTVFAVSGTQAEKSSWNSIEILKLSNLTGRKQKLVPIKTSMEVSDEDSDSSDSDDDGEEMDQPGPRRPTLQASSPLDFLLGLLRKVAHEGCVNRIRSMPQNPHICASWSDMGYVQVWDVSSHLNFLAESQSDVMQGTPSAFNQAPLAVFIHKDEGYAIDWSPVVPGRLLSGSKGLEGTSLACADPRDDHVNSCGWFQHIHAFKYCKLPSTCWHAMSIQNHSRVPARLFSPSEVNQRGNSDVISVCLPSDLATDC